MKRIILAAIGVIALGAGCSKEVTRLPSYPDLRVTRPTNGSISTSRDISIEGASNMPSVWIDGKEYLVTNGQFSVPTVLHPDANTFQLASGNGVTTSTVALTVTYSATTTTP